MQILLWISEIYRSLKPRYNKYRNEWFPLSFHSRLLHQVLHNPFSQKYPSPLILTWVRFARSISVAGRKFLNRKISTKILFQFLIFYDINQMVSNQSVTSFLVNLFIPVYTRKRDFRPTELYQFDFQGGRVKQLLSLMGVFRWDCLMGWKTAEAALYKIRMKIAKD